MEYQKFHEKLLKLLPIGDKFDGITISPEKDNKALDAEGLFRKFVYHCSTIDFLLKKTPSPLEKSHGFLDYASLIVIIRAAIETMLTFSYVFNLPPNNDEMELRYNLWIYGGLIQLIKEEPIIEENRPIFSIIQERTINIEKLIRNNTIFKDIKPKSAEKILKAGKWRIKIIKEENRYDHIGWAEIAEQVGFDNKNAKILYSFLSSYAHSDSLCISHIRVAKTESERVLIIDGALDILGFCVDLFGEIYPPTIKNLL